MQTDSDMRRVLDEACNPELVTRARRTSNSRIGDDKGRKTIDLSTVAILDSSSDAAVVRKSGYVRVAVLSLQRSRVRCERPTFWNSFSRCRDVI